LLGFCFFACSLHRRSRRPPAPLYPQMQCYEPGVGARMTEMQVEVDCYSGYKADEQPVRFRLDGREYLVAELLDQWYGQNDVFTGSAMCGQ